MISKSFFESLELVAEEKGLSIDDVLSKVEVAMSVACRDTDHNGEIKLEIDHEKKKIKVYEYHYVVDELTEGKTGELLVEAAKALKPHARIEAGSVIREEIDFTKIGRKSVSKFKQTFTNELKSLEREEEFKFFEGKVKEIITAVVVAANPSFVTFSIGKGLYASMPMTETIPGETFEPGEKKKVYILKVEKTTKEPKVYISRASKEIITKLFELNIPEIQDGSIEIMGVAREAGSRTKIGVLATKPNLDPKGACVGQGGLRIKAINSELNQEKIDIFTWRDNPVDLIAEALLPARSLSVVITNEKAKQALVIVNEEQYSLAIGKSGQNVRLACYATEWKIDIKKLSDALKEGIEFKYNVYIK